MLPRIPSKRLRLVIGAMFCALTLRGAAGNTQTLKLHAARTASTDLELLGLPGHPRAFLTHAQLESLPQHDVTVTDSPDYPNLTLHVSGVLLESLIEALHLPPGLDLVDANCTDRYHSTYTADYIAAHHPILVLAIEHQALDRWAAAAHLYDPSPYLIVYDHFKPSFRILAHDDEALVPVNLTQLRFTPQARFFAPLAPPPAASQYSTTQQGFTIARQNCLRCHSSNPAQWKSSTSWAALSTTAREHPAFFASWVHNPQSINPTSKMPPNPEYDEPTLKAITAYFQSLSPAKPRRAQTE